MEEIYIGTKVIAAEEMDELTFSLKVKPFAHTVAVDSNGNGQPGYKVRYEDGYVSWSPKETFERAYRKVTGAEMGMVIGGALKNVKPIPVGHHLDQVYDKKDMPKDIGSKD
jgi:hypothetical protein